ncbi:hypothetical protein ACFYZ9_07930 [Streptomyces sp. NPDC001691]|uniref:hypothetical protein n=1 Tax=unclassified Streptomyces TaxID=2593676 RepID=UPI000DE93165|nr:hypothetical protein [Streptomyces sp. SDr-06]RCH70679.1 hypothetical protein DT019_04100 [Streptomyces sp. SDr-06]
MWPGQQPPGGEQNPQDPNQNPYQQPGYQQPNPYQQPGQQPSQPGYPPQGYQTPNPYQQPTVPQYPVGSPLGAPQPPDSPDDKNKKKTTLIAIIAATAVVVAAAVTGVLVLKDDGKSTNQADKDKKSPSAQASGSDAPSSPAPNPRGAGTQVQPVIAGWKVVVNPTKGDAFDVPPDWEVDSPGMSVGWSDKADPNGFGGMMMSAPAYYKSKWCTAKNSSGRDENTALASVGTKGANGAKSTDDAAEQADDWLYYAYTQPDKNHITSEKPVPYTTKSGLQGSVVRAKTTGVKKTDKCSTEGQSVLFGFKTAKGDLAAWSFIANTGVPDAVPEDTIQKILSTIRLVPVTGSGS